MAQNDDRLRALAQRGAARAVQAMQDPYIGRTFKGKYRILSLIGSGGMGAVYKAHDVALNRHVAVKVLSAAGLGLPPSLAKEIMESNRPRFPREAQAAARVKSANVVEVYDFDTDDDACFLVMEYVEGASLAKLLAERGRLPPKEAREIILQVLDGLAVVHGAGIVHRDLKPANILLARSGNRTRAKICDFGVSKQAGSDGTMTAAGTGLGTPAYMSPEQCRGARDVDQRSDIYAVGVILYEMLTGEKLFKGANPLSIIRQHQIGRPDPMRFRTPAGEAPPPDLEAVVSKALAKKADARYQSAAEMRAAVAASRIDRPARKRSSAPLLIGAAAALALACLGIFLGPSFVGRPPSREAPPVRTTPAIAPLPAPVVLSAPPKTEPQAPVPVGPRQPPSLLHARRLADALDFKGAADELERLVKDEPENAEAWYELGSALARSGRADDADRAYRRFLATRGRDPRKAIFVRALLKQGH